MFAIFFVMYSHTYSGIHYKAMQMLLWTPLIFKNLRNKAEVKDVFGIDFYFSYSIQ